MRALRILFLRFIPLRESEKWEDFVPLPKIFYTMAAMNTADIGFEKEIWKAADKMRGNIDASEYKSVVLGLIS